MLPIQIGTAKWQKVVAANYHSMGIQEDGSVWVWGWNRYGQLGMGDTDSRSVPTEFGGLSSVNSVVANTTLLKYSRQLHQKLSQFPTKHR